MESENKPRTSSRGAEDARSDNASIPPKSDTDPRHPDDPRGYNPQAPGHTRAPARRGTAGIAVIIGVILVTSVVLFLIFGNDGLRDERAPVIDPTETGTADQPGTTPPTATDPAPTAPAAPPAGD